MNHVIHPLFVPLRARTQQQNRTYAPSSKPLLRFVGFVNVTAHRTPSAQSVLPFVP